MEIIEKMLEKLTYYEFLNYLIPGTVLSFILKYLGFQIFSNEVFVNIIICYLVGLINSRFSSVCIEELLKKTKFIKWKKYEEYYNAKKARPFIEKFMAHANMYRAFISVFVLSIGAFLYKEFVCGWKFASNNGDWILLILLLILFLFSYRKQINEYVVKNIEEANAEQQKK